MIRRAIILGAGHGRRLWPLTADRPKFMVELAGRTLLEHAAETLRAAGVEEIVLVVGHQRQVAMRHYGHEVAGLRLIYVECDDYLLANNIQSLWHARAYFDEDFFLLECDVVLRGAASLHLMLEPPAANVALISPYDPSLDGTVVSRDEDGYVSNIWVGGRGALALETSYKTVNVYLLRTDCAERWLRPLLEVYLGAGARDQFYEIVLAALVASGRLELRGAVIDRAEWCEIDDAQDLERAEYRWASREEKYRIVSTKHGRYWEYGFIDHYYLYNLYFPPDSLVARFAGDQRTLLAQYPAGQAEQAEVLSHWLSCAPDCLAVSNGASELIRILAQRVGRAGVLTPTFNEYESFVEPDRLHRIALPADSWTPDPGHLLREVRDHALTHLILISPNNPTSIGVPADILLPLLEELRRLGCTLVLDESFVDFCAQPAAYSLLPSIAQHRNLIIIKSLSKIFGIAGLRLGFLACGDELVIAETRASLPIWNVNSLADEFLRSLSRHRNDYERSLTRVRQDRDELFRDLQRIDGLKVWRPDANFIFCEVLDAAWSGPELARTLFVEHDILIKHCATKTMERGQRYLRIASRTGVENRRISACLRQYLG